MDERLTKAVAVLRLTESAEDGYGLKHYGGCLGRKLWAMADEPGALCDSWCIEVRAFLESVHLLDTDGQPTKMKMSEWSES